MRPIFFLRGWAAAFVVPTVLGQRHRVGSFAESVSVEEEIAETGSSNAKETIIEGETAPPKAEHDIVKPGNTVTVVEPSVPISAVLFSGSPGPKDCRGTPILKVNLPKPGSQHSTPKCYNVPGVAECGNFMAAEDDGCEARLFSERNCATFANVAVFVPERKAQGGYIRSIEIRCGIESTTPAPLNLPGIRLPAGAQQAARN
ncbi:hypothetical protein SLS62_010964 [Diatrype stigma]|uniref:Uncharacterized protein n=1 Tax=Diatrype stigma TaxID=117547 RepID=A0AAN9U883_9PEZI